MSDDHRYLLSIPLNIDDVDNIPEGVLFENIRFEEYQITKAEYESLYPLFCKFDDAFGILIDEYEEEVIPAEGICVALELSRGFAEEVDDATRAATEKFVSILCRAQELGKQLLLSF